ncbi:nitroreductase-like oxidoreductase [Clostridium aceticum]|uniref:Nitroreductase-like oxidoreductase n=1 Tax=Clostridium aceticum TaxID=84022 RepID=A0A0D8IC13_9CLOT|nr:nitroreductase family protein [Clostridium aceticum]AKL96907.1 nitroreductase-like oxidoreductase [Clostridium aceticum]KJF27639.1 nitroreductase [Clostridium aceticum]
MSKDFYTSIKNRRSIYGIAKEAVVSDERIAEVIEYAVKHTPSAFNSQSGRAVLLLGEQHDRLWDIVKKTLQETVSEKNFPKTEEKINSFRNGYGSVLFFEDQKVVGDLQEQFPLYKENFLIWSQQASGILQYIIWTSLEVEGFGASLQHYNPLIDEEVRKTWDIPSHWKLMAQLPFGKPIAAAGEKEFQAIEERVKIFK